MSLGAIEGCIARPLYNPPVQAPQPSFSNSPHQYTPLQSTTMSNDFIVLNVNVLKAVTIMKRLLQDGQTGIFNRISDDIIKYRRDNKVRSIISNDIGNLNSLSDYEEVSVLSPLHEELITKYVNKEIGHFCFAGPYFKGFNTFHQDRCVPYEEYEEYSPLLYGYNPFDDCPLVDPITGYPTYNYRDCYYIEYLLAFHYEDERVQAFISTFINEINNFDPLIIYDSYKDKVWHFFKNETTSFLVNDPNPATEEDDPNDPTWYPTSGWSIPQSTNPLTEQLFGYSSESDIESVIDLTNE